MPLVKNRVTMKLMNVNLYVFAADNEVFRLDKKSGLWDINTRHGTQYYT